MTGRERALATLAGKTTDRVAAYCDLRNPEAIRRFGGSGDGLEAMVNALSALGVDMTRELVRTPFPPPPAPQTLPDRSSVAGHVLDAFRKAEDAAGDRLLNLVEFPGSILGAVMAESGAMETLTLVGTAPDEAAGRLDRSTAACIEFAEMIASAGDVPAVLFMDDLAGNDGPFVAPETLRSLYFPRLREVVAILASAGTKVLFHSDGDLSLLQGDLAAAGVAGHHPVEPVGSWGLKGAASAGADTVVIGNAVLGKLHASADSAAEERHRCLAFAGSHDAFFLAPTAEIGPEVDPENLRALLTP
jgi:uroporphyrinogen-III decarboxylase